MANFTAVIIFGKVTDFFIISDCSCEIFDYMIALVDG